MLPCELFFSGQRVNLGQFAIDGCLQFKVENYAVDLASGSRDAFAFALVELVDAGVVVGFPPLDEAVIEDLADRCIRGAGCARYSDDRCG